MKRLFAAATGLALVAVLAACDDEPSTESDDEAYVVGPDDDYVAIGDSYTAAPGTGQLSAEDGCSQTVVNYPHLIAEATGVDLTDNSCNGANTSHLTQAKVGTDRGPQLDDIDEDTDLVTFRLGANDFGLILGVFACAQGALGKEAGACSAFDEAAGANGSEARLAALADNVTRGLQAVHDRAPDARIIVISYPQIIPPEGKCDLLPLPDGDDAWARGIIDGLNQALRDGADAVGATYVDMYAASEGHDTCSDEPWMAGIEAPLGDAIKWHPYPVESEMVADLVLEELQQS